MKISGIRRKLWAVQIFIAVAGIFAGIGLVMLTLRPVDLPMNGNKFEEEEEEEAITTIVEESGVRSDPPTKSNAGSKSCATVEEMGGIFGGGGSWKESLRVRKMIQHHFDLHGILFILYSSLLRYEVCIYSLEFLFFIYLISLDHNSNLTNSLYISLFSMEAIC